MTDTVHSFTWSFGGPLAGLAPAVAGSLLGAVAVAGLAAVVVSYRRTLVVLSPARRRTLAALRIAFWFFLIFALAGPQKIQRTFAQHERRPLAVLVDRSDSMTTADNRQQRRVDDALRRWRSLAPAAETAFASSVSSSGATSLGMVALLVPSVT